MVEKDSEITLEQFIQHMAAGGGIVPSPADCVEYAYQKGWLEAQDVLGRKSPVMRKSVARIVHEYLRREMKEADEIDGSPAYQLQDLFDCRVCAGHIIQVYVKGIMDGREHKNGGLVFETEKFITAEEASEIVFRLFDKEKRNSRGKCKDEEETFQSREPEEITPELAIELIGKGKNVILLDVRTKREFEEGHMENAIHIPLMELMKNPYAVSEIRDTKILLYCGEGYQSMAAARCLLEAGYKNASYFAWKQSGK